MDSGPTGRRRLNRGLLESLQLGGIANRSDAEVGAALLRLAHDELEAFGTDGEQRTSEDDIRNILQTCRRLTKRTGVNLDLPFSDFRTFKSHWRANGAVGSWQARRDILDGLFNPVHRELANLEDAAADLQSPAGSTEASPEATPAYRTSATIHPLPPTRGIRAIGMSSSRTQPRTRRPSQGRSQTLCRNWASTSGTTISNCRSATACARASNEASPAAGSGSSFCPNRSSAGTGRITSSTV